MRATCYYMAVSLFVHTSIMKRAKLPTSEITSHSMCSLPLLIFLFICYLQYKNKAIHTINLIIIESNHKRAQLVHNGATKNIYRNDFHWACLANLHFAHQFSINIGEICEFQQN